MTTLKTFSQTRQRTYLSSKRKGNKFAKDYIVSLCQSIHDGEISFMEVASYSQTSTQYVRQVFNDWIRGNAESTPIIQELPEKEEKTFEETIYTIKDWNNMTKAERQPFI